MTITAAQLKHVEEPFQEPANTSVKELSAEEKALAAQQEKDQHYKAQAKEAYRACRSAIGLPRILAACKALKIAGQITDPALSTECSYWVFAETLNASEKALNEKAGKQTLQQAASIPDANKAKDYILDVYQNAFPDGEVKTLAYDILPEPKPVQPVRPLANSLSTGAAIRSVILDCER